MIFLATSRVGLICNKALEDFFTQFALSLLALNFQKMYNNAVQF